MQLDADEDGEPFFKPPAVTAAPIQTSGGALQSQVEQQPRDNEETAVEPEGETSQIAAEAVTAEQEE